MVLRELFYQHQVFEKMLIQHEYLHQVAFEEVVEYVEEIVGEGSNELVLYHGSSSEFSKVDLSKSHNRRDFGKDSIPLYYGSNPKNGRTGFHCDRSSGYTMYMNFFLKKVRY